MRLQRFCHRRYCHLSKTKVYILRTEQTMIRGPLIQGVYLPNLTGVPLPQDVVTLEESEAKWL